MLVGGRADKQRKIEKELKEINAKWAEQIFTFQDWKGRGINILKGALSATTDDGCTDLPLPRQRQPAFCWTVVLPSSLTSRQAEWWY